MNIYNYRIKNSLILLISALSIHITGCSQNNSRSELIYKSLKGSYLGQERPTKKAEIFGPNIISTDQNEALYGIFNNGSYIVFDRVPKDFTDWENDPVYIMQIEDGQWTKPILTKYLGQPWYFDFPNPVNGTGIFYASWLPLDKNGKITDINIYKVKYRNGSWDRPVKLPFPINTEYFDTWPSVTKDKILYFFSTRKSGYGGADIYRSIPENGKYKTIENLGGNINSSGLDHDPCISQDGSFLIYSSNMAGSLGKDDLYVSFQGISGKWTKPVNLGSKVNSEASDNRPYLTPDEKYLFFTSTRNGNLDIFWIDAKIIKEIKHKVFN